MAKLIITCIASLLLLAPDLQKGDFTKFRSVETYEIRPGILAMPIYSGSGEVCSIILEKQHVSSTGIDLDAEMSRDEIYGIFDGLVSRSERNQSKLSLEDKGETTIFDGGTLTTTAKYENVLLQMYGKAKKTGPEKYVAARVQWKKRGCHDYPSD